MNTFRTFPNAQDARDYRYEHGTGGWIFTNSELTVLFPPEYSPSMIFRHPFVKGMDGHLIGSA